jgi:2-polyprenyl-6-methoxyphenol hydroxylase-like FAD-dependent oxidoreductase
MRARAGLAVENLGAPMDVLWFRLRYEPDDPEESLGFFGPGSILVTINRGDYWQCAYVIPKGSFDALRNQGLEEFHSRVVHIQPRFGDRISEVGDWDAVKLLEVRVDRLKRWHKPGLLLIGDAAHAMSPVGGVGVNLAIQDAVASANILAAPLLSGVVNESVLSRIQRRRELPVAITQRLQIAVQNRVIGQVLATRGEMKPPMVLGLFNKFPMLRYIPGRIIGMGVRPEHVHTPAAV